MAKKKEHWVTLMEKLDMYMCTGKIEGRVFPDFPMRKLREARLDMIIIEAQGPLVSKPGRNEGCI